MLNYPVILTPDDGTVQVTFPDVPEAITFGADEGEALLQAVDALESALSVYVAERAPLPVPSKAKRGQHTVRPSALEGAKLGVYQAMTEQGIKKSELARRLGWHMPQVDRLFDLRHASRLDQIEAAARVLGKQLELRIA
jgi:antitoxin HicB